MTLFMSNFTVDRLAVGGAHFVRVVHKVAAYSESNTFGFCLGGRSVATKQAYVA
jgi:hypothetical protein